MGNAEYMGKQSQHCLEHILYLVAIIMRCLVLVGSVLACVSSAQSTFDTGYGVPAAPVLVTRVSPLPSPIIPQPILPASLPLTAQPLPFSLPPPQPFLVPSAAPLAQPLPFAPIAPVAPIVEPPSSQFHAQDEFGQFSFGYQNINSARSETKDAFGVTRGSYQYVDANNVVQTVHYTADDINGFRVAATNVPVAPAAAVGLPVAPEVPVSAPLVAPVPVVETPEVATARAEHLAAHEAAKAEVAAVSERRRREAEPIEAGYGIPAAPVLRVSPFLVQPPVLPAPVALAHQPLVLPAPVHAPLPFAAQPFPQPVPVHQPFLVPSAAPLAHHLPIAPVAPIVEPPSSQFRPGRVRSVQLRIPEHQL